MSANPISGYVYRCFSSRLTVLLVVFFGFAWNAKADDTVEFLNGSTMSGKMLKIRKAEKNFDFQSTIAGTDIKSTYSYSKVHAVTFNGKRFVLTPKNNGPGTADASGPRTEREVQELIDAASDPPDWYASTKLNHPKTLNLEWPLKVTGKWNESKNVGQYIWGRVNPNKSRWKPGIKLIYECMRLHEKNPTLLKRDRQKLGEMYFTLLQDYPRAAHWLQKSNVSASTPAGVYLAECYWRLGNKAMANKQLRGRTLHFDAIKLLGDMGEIDRALSVTKGYASTGSFNQAFLNAGDALRGVGRFDEAIDYYQQILDRNQARNKEYLARFRARAKGAIEAIKLFDQADATRVADGTYNASSMGYNGSIEIAVRVVSGKIEKVDILKHREKQFYAAFDDTPRQIIDQQGIRDVDGTSGATITSQAVVHATAVALAKGFKP